MLASLFERRDDACYAPTELAHGPWARGFLHGGPVCGLAAHAAETLRPGDEFVATRLTVDMHRPVPMAPLEVLVTREATSRRLLLARVAIRAEGREVTQASVLFMRRGEAPERPPLGRSPTKLGGPAGLETTTLIPRERFDLVPPGFHREVELRWVPQRPPAPRAAWLRAPMAFVDGQRPSPFVHAASLSDLGNAIATLATHDDEAPAASYINPDTTLYLEREPSGEWIALELDTLSETSGVGLSNVVLHDVDGAFGRTISARIFNPFPR